MAASAIWKAAWRRSLTILVPLLIGFSFKLVSDQSVIVSRVAGLRRKLPGL